MPEKLKLVYESSAGKTFTSTVETENLEASIRAVAKRNGAKAKSREDFWRTVDDELDEFLDCSAVALREDLLERIVAGYDDATEQLAKALGAVDG